MAPRRPISALLDETAELRGIGYPPELALTFSLFSSLTSIVTSFADNAATPRPLSPPFSFEVSDVAQTSK